MTRPPFVIHQYQAPGNRFIQELIELSFRKWPWFLAAQVVALGLCFLYLAHKQPIYQISAKILIKDPQKGVEEISAQREGHVPLPKKNIENEIEILRSSVLMKRVVDKLNLTVSYYASSLHDDWSGNTTMPFDIKFIEDTPLLYSKGLDLIYLPPNKIRIDDVEYAVGKPIKTAYGTFLISLRSPQPTKPQLCRLRFVTVKQKLEQLSKDLKIEVADKNSTVIQLSIEDVLPARGESILRQLLVEYSQASVLEKNKSAATALQLIDQRIEGLSADVNRIESQASSYKSAQKITDLSNQADYILRTAQDNDAQVNQVSIQLAILDDLEKSIKSRTGKRSITPATLGLQDEVLVGLIERLNQLEQERAELEKLTSEQNFLVKNLTNQIEESRMGIKENINTMRTMLTSTKQQLQNRNVTLESQIRTIPKQEQALIGIIRQQNIKSELYTYMLKKREEMALSIGAALSDNLVIDPPQSSSKPVKPVKAMVLGFFMLIGFACTLGVIAGIKIYNDRTEPKGGVSFTGNFPQDPLTHSLFVNNMRPSASSEQIRGLRANLQLMRGQSSQSMVLLIVSSISGDEKTLISQNLGASLALARSSTVLVEMDLHNSMLHREFGVPNDLGISDYLKGECPLDAIIKPIPGYDHLYLVPSGIVSGSPLEMISNPRLGNLLNALRDQFEFILVDTIPSSIISEAQLLAPFADTTLFVVNHDITPKNCLQVINYINKENRFPKPLIVLNDVPGGSSYDPKYIHEQMSYNSS